MIALEVDMVQYDCPYIDTTADHDVAFYTKQWDFDAASHELETRSLVEGGDRGALDDGLAALRDHGGMCDFELLRRKDDTALIRSRIGQTNAMKVIRRNDGYITGPFRIREGSEVWNVGFDSQAIADEALSDLDRNNDFEVESRTAMDLEDYHDLMRNREAATALLEVCRSLSAVERETLAAAVEEGYFTTPREATLSSIADAFDVSKMAASKNLRRSQRKVLSEVVGAIESIED